MVCIRCILAVQSVLESNQVMFQSIELGKVKLIRELTGSQRTKVASDLKYYELEIVEGKNRILVELIKAEIIKLLNRPDPTLLKLSAHLSKTLDYNYTYLASNFSQTEGHTLEKFFITQRVEKAKEMMVYQNKSLSEITQELNYSSVSHLCLQFRKVAGITPMEFRKLLQSEDYVWRNI